MKAEGRGQKTEGKELRFGPAGSGVTRLKLHKFAVGTLVLPRSIE